MLPLYSEYERFQQKKNTIRESPAKQLGKYVAFPPIHWCGYSQVTYLPVDTNALFDCAKSAST